MKYHQKFDFVCAVTIGADLPRKFKASCHTTASSSSWTGRFISGIKSISGITILTVMFNTDFYTFNISVEIFRIWLSCGFLCPLTKKIQRQKANKKCNHTHRCFLSGLQKNYLWQQFPFAFLITSFITTVIYIFCIVCLII